MKLKFSFAGASFLGIFISTISCWIMDTATFRYEDAINRVYNLLYIPPDDEVGMKVEHIIRKYGYPVEVHDIVTEDGYILTTFRIPHGKQNNSSPRGRHREPVLINHAFLSSAASYFITTPDNVLPFMYADAGFDVWIGNLRGNSFALRHKNYLSSDLRFWNFTMDETAFYDVPAQIDYVLNLTQQTQLVYYGYSLGGGIILQTLALRPEYGQKIRRMTIVANSGFYCESSSPGLNNNLPLPLLKRFYDSFFNGRFVITPLGQPTIPYLCRVFRRTCYFILELAGDVNTGHVSLKTLTRMLHTFPEYTSVKLYMQVLQWCRSGHLSHYDYGEAGNLAQYASAAPPMYNDTHVTVPMCALYGFRDNVVPLKGAIYSMGKLKNWCNRENPLIQDKNWSHLDSMYGNDVGNMVYARSIRFHLQDEESCSC